MSVPVVSRGARIVTQHPHLMANYARAEINIVRGEGVLPVRRIGEPVPRSRRRHRGRARSGTRIRASRARSRIKPRRWSTAAISTTTNRPARSPTGWPSSRGFDAVFFCNSGTEANEAAIKLARKYAWRKGETERTTILAAQRLVSRPHVRRAGRHRQPGVQRRLRAAAGRLRVHAVQRRRRALERDRRSHGRLHRRTRARRERRRAGHAGVSRRRARLLHATRRAADLR